MSATRSSGGSFGGPPAGWVPDRRVRIPADIDRPDRLLAGLTARQLCWLAAGGTVGYLLFAAVGQVAPLPVAAGLAAVPLLVSAVLAFAGRDGLPGDRLIGAALAHRRNPADLVAAPADAAPLPGWASALLDSDSDSGAAAAAGWGLPVRSIADAVGGPEPGRTAGRAGDTHTALPERVGALDLGSDGTAVLAAASCVNFSLRSPTEQDALTTAFGRYLNSCDGSLQILLRAHPLDAAPLTDRLRRAAGGLPHPALETAALEHADYLQQLSAQPGVLHRQALLVLRDPRPPAVAGPLLTGRIADAQVGLARAGITVRPLSAGEAGAVLAQAADPTNAHPPTPAAAATAAAAGEVITADLSWSSR
jgi:hypothetical protein